MNLSNSRSVHDEASYLGPDYAGPLIGELMASDIFDTCLCCGSRFVGVEGKLAAVIETDTHRRLAYLCADCAQTKTAVIS